MVVALSHGGSEQSVVGHGKKSERQMELETKTSMARESSLQKQNEDLQSSVL